MRNRLIKLGMPLVVVASLAAASPASAAPLCFGTANTAGACVDVDPSGGPTHHECVYLGPPPCIPVSVTLPDVDCWGWIGSTGVWQCTF